MSAVWEGARIAPGHMSVKCQGLGQNHQPSCARQNPFSALSWPATNVHAVISDLVAHNLTVVGDSQLGRPGSPALSSPTAVIPLCLGSQTVCQEGEDAKGGGVGWKSTP